MKDANAEYVQKLRVTESDTDQEIQNALHQLFRSSPQGTNSSILAPIAISKIQLDNSLKNSLHTAFQSETRYSEILQDLSGGTRQIVKNI